MRPPAPTLLLACALALVLAAPAAAAPPAPAPPLARGPSHPLGTFVLVHAGGWAGPNAARQAALMQFPGAALRMAGWRTVSLDYAPGEAGLDSVLDQLDALLARTRRPVCMYGESAGGHLALLAAGRRPRRLRCTVTLGAPTHFGAWLAEAQATGNLVSLAVFASTVLPAFGAAPARRLQPALVAERIRGRLLLVSQGDDGVVPRGQAAELIARRPRTRQYVTGSGDASRASDLYLHGTLPAGARAALARRVIRFAAAAALR